LAEQSHLKLIFIMPLPLVSLLIAHILPADWSLVLRWGVVGLGLLVAGVMAVHYWRQLRRPGRE
jgi:hypothetical protein